jgi:hypothetical protein
MYIYLLPAMYIFILWFVYIYSLSIYHLSFTIQLIPKATATICIITTIVLVEVMPLPHNYINIWAIVAKKLHTHD